MPTPIAPNRATVTTRAAAEATGGRIVRIRGDGALACGITSDSRAVVAGSAFVALTGEKFDGHDFVATATDRGAALLVVARGRDPGPDRTGTADVVEVDDTLVAWGRLARAHIRDWRARRAPGTDSVLAITGSAGKTTTKELCAALLRSRASCHASAGNLNNRVGVPAVAFGLTPEHRYAVFEAGMSLRGEIAALAEILAPDVAVVTNIGVAHAEGVGGTRADVAREKGALLGALAESGVAVVRREDDAAMAELVRTRAKRILTFGTTESAAYRLVDRSTGPGDGSIVWIERSGERLQAHLPIPGEAAALDLMAALAATEAVAGAMRAEEITNALRTQLPAIAGRMQVRHAANGTIVLDDSYNANPESVRAALCTLREVSRSRGRRAAVVLGEMRELGPLSHDEHAALGSAIAGSHATLAIAIGEVAELAIAAAEGAGGAGVTGVRAADVEQAGRVAAALLEPGDVVLVKASRSVGADRVVLALLQAGGGEIPARLASPEDAR